MRERYLRAYGWIFAATGLVFVLGPGPLGGVLNLLEARLPSSAPLPHAPRTFWLVLTGSMMAMLAYLSFAAARDPRRREALDALLLSKGMSTALFVLYAAWDNNAAFLVGAVVDGAILAHLAVLRRGLPAAAVGELLSPRFFPGRAPFHEAWFAKINDPKTGDALWLRYTLTSGRAGGVASLWYALFDQAGGKVRRGRADSPLDAAELGLGARHVRIKDGWLAGDRLRGRLAVASWDLEWEALAAPPFRFVPPSLSLTGLACAEYRTPVPLARFRGKAVVDGREFRVDDARGSIGHLWGRRLADEWRWAHAVLDAGGEPAVFEILSSRLRLGPWRTPWLTTANLWRGGSHLQSAGLRVAFGNSSELVGGGWAFRVAFPGFKVEGECAQDAQLTAEIVYDGPCGERRLCRNSKTGSMRLRLRADGGLAETLSTENAAAVEFVESA